MSTSNNIHRTFGFERFMLDLDRGVLSTGGKDIKLHPKSFQVLEYLIERHGCLVTKEEILDALWGSMVVTSGDAQALGNWRARRDGPSACPRFARRSELPTARFVA